MLDANAPTGYASARLYIHPPRGRTSRHIDDSTEGFVDKTRMGVTLIGLPWRPEVLPRCLPAARATVLLRIRKA
jgi:hypothetical protein